LRQIFLIALAIALAGCGRLDQVGKAPSFTPVENGDEFFAMTSAGLPGGEAPGGAGTEASLWSGTRASLLGDRRAGQRGDILTVVVEIDDKAEISNSSDRRRSS